MTQQGQFLMSPPDQFLMSFDIWTWIDSLAARRPFNVVVAAVAHAASDSRYASGNTTTQIKPSGT